MSGQQRPRARLVPVMAAGVLVLAACGTSVAATETDPYEVWTVDQSNSAGLEYGGTLYIHDGTALTADAASAPAEVIDLGGAVSEQCMAETGANPVRPHIVLFNDGNDHAIVSFVASGHVAFLDASTREPVKCFRTTEGFDGARQAHAAFPAPDDSYVIVANQNGKLLERIDTDADGNGTPFEGPDDLVHDTAATLDLATGNAPSGAPLEDPDLRPNNTVICPIISADSRLTFITLGGGGLFVADTSTGGAAPPIIAEYDTSVVGPHGCGGMQPSVETGDRMYINSGAGPTHLSNADLYSFPLDGYEAGTPNEPAPTVVFSRAGHGAHGGDPTVAPAEGSAFDSHGMVLTGPDDRYLWVFDRAANAVEVVDTTDDSESGSFTLTGDVSADPAPDLGAVSPDGAYAFASLRGPCPITANFPPANNSVGATPGVGVLSIVDGGGSGELIGIAPISNLDSSGTSCAPEGAPASAERADPHAIAVRTVD